jgi:hypothetical protein
MNGSDYSVERALNFVRGCRPIVRPNSGFMMELKKWQQELGRKDYSYLAK